MNIDLPSEMSAAIENLVSTGRFSSESEAVVEGLRLLMAREQLIADVREGFAQVERVEWVDGDEALDELEAQIDALIAKRQAASSTAMPTLSSKSLASSTASATSIH